MCGEKPSAGDSGSSGAGAGRMVGISTPGEPLQELGGRAGGCVRHSQRGHAREARAAGVEVSWSMQYMLVAVASRPQTATNTVHSASVRGEQRVISESRALTRRSPRTPTASTQASGMCAARATKASCRKRRAGRAADRTRASGLFSLRRRRRENIGRAGGGGWQSRSEGGGGLQLGREGGVAICYLFGRAASERLCRSRVMSSDVSQRAGESAGG